MPPNAPRRIAHLDMDAFYASVELLRYPDLRGRAVVIGGGRNAVPEDLPDGSRRYARLRDYVGRGVVTTSTYEARALGVFSAMGMMKAAKLAPDAILLPTDFDAYRRYSGLFKAAVRTFTGQIEDRGIDEIYIDLSDIEGEPQEVAGRIKAAVHDATGLTCSICVAPNKLLAKIGSELDKPNGLTILTPADIPTRIWPLPARKVNGIGPKAAEKLQAIGIDTVGDLAEADLALLQAHFGRNYAGWLVEVAHGRDDRQVVVSSEPKSMSRETTFERDLHPRNDRPMLSEQFTKLCMRVADDLRRKGYVGRTVGIKLRFDDFHTVTRDLTMTAHTADGAAIRRGATECLKRIPLERRIRLLGVRVSALLPAGEQGDDPAPVQEEFRFDDEAEG
ncbi:MULTISPECIES: DNA polymerase IV [unclassified Cupriavidus]|uniref:DNA polymerase IV n=1 Tax=unclassified Cupriavidus TaxID=2640874 RepID=UPI001BFFFB6B|nr:MULTISPECIES: DNA polymerase IV [unclassified Cupriavidus]MCA3186194.1 DNA polymerase IV [Cupriavidus sp.]MCA3190145.1 DNA polymerase IV [Cupriavidus sp.]MCA3197596.1 DNA polymerase IV [Cupriavidus sp.]MCA3201935.1 DNA polymerase IV [Cupriavidus sp.]MCA3208053.1 DNA polymerase IV [Cupriavidus sp.]